MKTIYRYSYESIEHLLARYRKKRIRDGIRKAAAAQGPEVIG